MQLYAGIDGLYISIQLAVVVTHYYNIIYYSIIFLLLEHHNTPWIV